MEGALMENCTSGASDRHTMSITWESFRHCGAIVTALLQVSSLLSWIIGREDNRDALQDKEKMDNLSKWIILGTVEQTHSSASIKNPVRVSLLTRWQSQVCYRSSSLAIVLFREVLTQQGDYTNHCLSLSSAHHSCPGLWWKTFPCNSWNEENYFQCYLTWEELNKNTQPGGLRQLQSADCPPLLLLLCKILLPILTLLLICTTVALPHSCYRKPKMQEAENPYEFLGEEKVGAEMSFSQQSWRPQSDPRGFSQVSLWCIEKRNSWKKQKGELHCASSEHIIPAPPKNFHNLAWNDSSCLVFSLLIGRKVSPGLVSRGSAKNTAASPQTPRSEEETPSHRDTVESEDWECSPYSNSWFSCCN